MWGKFYWGVSEEIYNDNRGLTPFGIQCMVGVERFELPTSCSQSLQQGKTGILGNCVFATFSKNIKQLTYAGCQSEIPPNSPRFRMNRKYCYQSATKFSMVYLKKAFEKYLARMGLWRVSDWELAGDRKELKYDGVLRNRSCYTNLSTIIWYLQKIFGLKY